MNILITVSVRWWNANAYYAISTAKALADSGHDVVVAGDPDYPPTKHAQEWGLSTIEIRFASLNPLIVIHDLIKLYKFIKRNKIEIINAFRSEDHLWTGLIKKKCAIPLVRSLGDVRPPKDNIFNRWLHFKATDFHILSSESILTRYLSTWPEFKPEMAIINGGIDPKQIYPVSDLSQIYKKFGIRDDSLIVGIVGRLSPVKDHETFIMAASLILEKIPNVFFIISGIEEEVPVKQLISFAESLNLNSHLKYFDKHIPVRELLSVLDVGVIASKGSEVIARIALEYLATGTPVVTTDINVLPEVIVNGRNGIIVQSEDPFSMAQAVIKLLQDTDLLKEISKNNLEDFKLNYDILLVAKKVEKIYAKLIEQNNDRNN